jgi:hypothetical protein
MSKIAIACVTVLVAMGSWYGLRAQPTTTAPAPAAVPERAFTGKVLMITLKSDSDWSLTIENPTLARSGGREFLVGACINDGSDEEDWRAGLTVWTAMDDVSQIIEARDRDELKEKLQESAEQAGKPTRA